MGAAQVTGIDLSRSSVELAQRRAARAGFGEHASFRTGNALEAEATAHDWVVLDRVVCCFGDADGLIDRATSLAGERIGLTAPESRGWRGIANRVVWNLETAWDLMRGGCRGYVHDLGRIERRLVGAGFRRLRTARSGLWYVGVYEREPKTADSPDSRSRGA
jgi:magnesium-protoporphyrin O-methyltransferase